MDELGAGQLGLVKAIEQSLFSIAFDLTAIFAGLIVAASSGLFSREPWIIALYPGILSMRGVIGGLFSARLSTGLHLGTIEASLVGGNTHGLSSLLSSIILLTFESSAILGSIGLLAGAALWGVTALNALAIFSVLITTMSLSLLLISPITIVVAFSAFRKGLDPDIIVYPVVSTIADILVTLCYALVLTLFFSTGTVGSYAVLSICIIFVSIALAVSYKNRREREFIKTIKEAFFTLISVAIIVNITGAALSGIYGGTRQKTQIYIVYPVLINVMGDVGAIVGATATTKLALGTIDSSIGSIKHHRNQILGAWSASVVVYLVLALVSFSFQPPASLLSVLRFTCLLLTTNISAAVFMIFLSFSVAILAFHRGLDPDNFVIPLESSLADTITTLSLLAMLGLIGY